MWEMHAWWFLAALQHLPLWDYSALIWWEVLLIGLIGIHLFSVMRMIWAQFGVLIATHSGVCMVMYACVAMSYKLIELQDFLGQLMYAWVQILRMICTWSWACLWHVWLLWSNSQNFVGFFGEFVCLCAWFGVTFWFYFGTQWLLCHSVLAPHCKSVFALVGLSVCSLDYVICMYAVLSSKGRLLMIDSLITT